MGLLINDAELKEATISAEELRLEIAILLYQMKKLSSGKASKFAGIPRVIFQKELGKRKIPVNFGEDDLEKDLRTLRMA